MRNWQNHFAYVATESRGMESHHPLILRHMHYTLRKSLVIFLLASVPICRRHKQHAVKFYVHYFIILRFMFSASSLQLWIVKISTSLESCTHTHTLAWCMNSPLLQWHWPSTLDYIFALYLRHISRYLHPSICELGVEGRLKENLKTTFSCRS